MKVLATFASSLILTLGIGIRAQTRAEPILRLGQTIALPGVTGGFDHLAYDPQHKRLLLAAADQGTVEVMDLEQGRKVGSIVGFKNPHSILFRPGASSFLVTDSGADASALVDAAGLKRIRTLKLALGANCVLFDPQRKVVYVTAGGDRVGEATSTLEAVDPDTGDVLRSVQVEAVHLQPMALDPETGRLFVNIADQNVIGIYNRDTLARIATWRISKGSRNSPIILDARHRRLFVVASEPGILLELDAESGELRSSVSTPPNPDDIAFDSTTGRIYVPGSGALSVYDVSTPGRIRLLQQVTTGANGRTGLLFESGAKFAVAVPAAGSEAARVLIYDIRR